MKLTGIILTKNAQVHVEKCIKSMLFCDELIVIDDGSRDKTKSIVKGYGLKLYSHLLNNDFSKHRNYALSKAKYDWVLFLDDDELISEKLAEEIKKTLGQNHLCDGYYLRRYDKVWRKLLTHGEAGHINLLRLGRKSKGEWHRKVHEQWVIRGKTGRLKNPIIHYSHLNVNQFVDSINKWSKLHAQENENEDKSANLVKIMVWPIGHFINSYILKLGFLDGLEGFVYAILMSFHSFLAWSTLWLAKRKY